MTHISLMTQNNDMLFIIMNKIYVTKKVIMLIEKLLIRWMNLGSIQSEGHEIFCQKFTKMKLNTPYIMIKYDNLRIAVSYMNINLDDFYEMHYY